MKAQARKTKFRRSSKWMKFRKRMKAKQKVCQLTLRPLLKGWNLHHMNLDEEFYEDITNENNFKCLNKKSHEVVHFLFRYYINDEDIIKRLEYILKEMKRVNSSRSAVKIKEEEV
jgi:hypothetical protein